MNNCVGPKNRRIFVIFTFFASITCGLCALLAFVTKTLAPCQHLSLYETQMCYMFEFPIVFIGNWTFAMVSMWTGLLLLSQLQMVAAETTTFESIRSRSNIYIPRRIVEDYRRALRNIMVFLYSGKYTVTKVFTLLVMPMLMSLIIAGREQRCFNPQPQSRS